MNGIIGLSLTIGFWGHFSMPTSGGVVAINMILFDSSRGLNQKGNMPQEEEPDKKEVPYLEGLRERRGLMRMEAIKQSEECDSVALLKDIAEMQAQTAQTMAWMAQKMRDTDNTVQFLIRENALLRSRQTERQQLIRALQSQHQSGVSSQLSGLAQQQTAIINALSAFSLSFHQPPPAVDDDPLLE
jgi:hypothetical protein